MYSFYCFPVKTDNGLKHCRCFFHLTKKREVITNIKLVQMQWSKKSFSKAAACRCRPFNQNGCFLTLPIRINKEIKSLKYRQWIACCCSTKTSWWFVIKMGGAWFFANAQILAWIHGMFEFTAMTIPGLLSEKEVRIKLTADAEKLGACCWEIFFG